MSVIISREDYAPASGKNLNVLLINGERAAVVGPMQPETADLFVSYFGEQWKWWALVTGVSGLTWLVRNPMRQRDFPLLLEAIDKPTVVKSKWDSIPPQRGHARTRRTRRVKVKA